MNYSILFWSLILVPGTAGAGDSIIDITSVQSGGGAIMEFHCTTCAPVDNGPKVEHSGVSLEQTQIDGKNKTVQIDNMMGGSPVRIVRSAGSSADERTTDGVAVFDEHPAPARRRNGEATAQVTTEGGGEFHVDEVTPGSDGEESFDSESQTSSINMENAEDDNVDGPEPTGPAPDRGGPEILDLRPGTTVGPQDQ